MKSILNSELKVINLGLERFFEPLKKLGVEAINCDWQPPAQGNIEAGKMLAYLMNHPLVEKANEDALNAYLSSNPVLKCIGTASQEITAMKNGEKLILHAGPCIRWSDMCSPQKGAVIGACILEGWASSESEADSLINSGKILLDSCNHHNAVGPMAGVISPSMPVWVIEDTVNKKCTYSNFNEGLGKVLRFGANDDEVINRLKWMGSTLAPVLKKILSHIPPIELKPLIAQAIHMGDECHNRNIAATSLFTKKIISVALKHEVADYKTLTEVFSFITGNDHFFLNISMAACKAMLIAASGYKYSSMVTVMARNGVNFGIQISAFKDEWFEATANYIDGLYFPGYSCDDAARDLGDSAITETCGIGGFSMAAAPAIVQFVGGTSQDAVDNTLKMREITLGSNPNFTHPMLNFTGAPCGIDIRKVVDSGIQPVINTGIAHKDAGVGQIGAGLTYAPYECFHSALEKLYKLVRSSESGV